jgi:hypothetical protein
MRNISNTFHLFLSLFLLLLGLFFFSLPFSAELSSFFFSHLPLFSLLGLGLIVFGMFFILGISSLYFSPSLTLKVSSYEVSLPLIRELLQRYCEKMHPEKKIVIEVFPQRKQRLEITVHLQAVSSWKKEDPFLLELKKEIKEYLRRQLDYHRTFLLTIFPSESCIDS